MVENSSLRFVVNIELNRGKEKQMNNMAPSMQRVGERQPGKLRICTHF